MPLRRPQWPGDGKSRQASVAASATDGSQHTATVACRVLGAPDPQSGLKLKAMLRSDAHDQVFACSTQSECAAGPTSRRGGFLDLVIGDCRKHPNVEKSPALRPRRASDAMRVDEVRLRRDLTCGATAHSAGASLHYEQLHPEHWPIDSCAGDRQFRGSHQRGASGAPFIASPCPWPCWLGS